MAGATRPVSIRRFEQLFYLGLAVGAVAAWALAANADALAYRDWSRPGYILLEFVINTGVNLLLLWLIAYRGSNIARWIFIGLVVIGVVSVVASGTHALDYGGLFLALTLIQSLLCAIEIFLLFRPDSRDWFAGRRPIDPGVFS